ncbi:hypothetical protein F4777DRAFT_571680 [Nemania sp. FL0916]|nr:hypothetical protein F4777DRAFT_571680 [Nemania sp. FL0916]
MSRTQYEYYENWPPGLGNLQTHRPTGLGVLQTHRQPRPEDLQTPILRTSQAMAVICYLETGSIGIQTLSDDTLDGIIGFAFGDSILVRSELLRDPWLGTNKAARRSPVQISRLLGNVGKPGLTLLSTPSDLMIADRDPGAWRTSNYALFDGSFINCFSHTSMHLKMLDWSLPIIDDEALGQLTMEAHIVEAVVSVHDRGVWLGDIDILSALPNVEFVQSDCVSNHHDSSNVGGGGLESIHAIALDTWDEVLDCPQDGMVVIRSQGSWIARLAIIGMLAHNRKVLSKVSVCPENSSKGCWRCLSRLGNNARRPRLKVFIL